MDSLEVSVWERFRVPIAIAAIFARDDELDGFGLVHFRTGGVERATKLSQLFWRHSAI